MKLWIGALAILLPALAAAPDLVPGNTFGNPKAPVIMEVFSDFQCPACKRFHDEELPLIVKDYVNTGKAYLVYRYFPLPQHTYGRKAAELVCACAEMENDAPWRPICCSPSRTNGRWMASSTKLGYPCLSPAEQKKLDTLAKDARGAKAPSSTISPRAARCRWPARPRWWSLIKCGNSSWRAKACSMIPY